MINRIMPINGRSKIWDITSLPSLYNTILGVLGTLNDIMKQGGVILSHGGLILPGSLIYLKVIPLHFQLECSALLLSNICKGSGANSPSGYARNNDQSMTCLVS